MSIDTWCLILNNSQLLLAASILQINSLFGLPDLIDIGRTQDNTEQYVTTLQELAELHLIDFSENGGYNIDYALASMLFTCAEAKNSLLITKLEADNGIVSRFIHISPTLLVEQETLPTNDIAFTAVKELSTLYQRTQSYLELPQALETQCSSFTLMESDLDAVRRSAQFDGVENCQRYLVGLGVPSESAITLATALANGTQTGSATLLDRTNEETLCTDSLAWIRGQSAVWMVIPIPRQIPQADSPRALRLIPTSTDGLLQRVELLINSSATTVGFVKMDKAL